MAEDLVRIDPPLNGSEFNTLNAFLDYHRATLLGKIAGVSDDKKLRNSPLAGITPNPMPLNLLGLVKHLGYVERSWFQVQFLNITGLSVPWSKADPDADLRIEPDESSESVLQFYNEMVEQSRQIVQQTLQAVDNDEIRALETLSKAKDSNGAARTLRWIIIHMIEETARHNGHADILRELIDGATGE